MQEIKLADKYMASARTITPAIEARVMCAINKDGRNPCWFNYDAACDWLARHPKASADTAIALYDYARPRTIVIEYRYDDDYSEYGGVATECWREWNGRIWYVRFEEDHYGESGALIQEVSEPGGTRLDISENDYYMDIDCDEEEPTLAQLGL